MINIEVFINDQLIVIEGQTDFQENSIYTFRVRHEDEVVAFPLTRELAIAIMSDLEEAVLDSGEQEGFTE